MKPHEYSTLETTLNEDNEQVVRVELAHDRDFMKIVEAAKNNHSDNSDYSSVKNNDIILYAERTKESPWYLHMRILETNWMTKPVFTKQYLSLVESNNLEKTMIEHFGDEYTQVWNENR